MCDCVFLYDDMIDDNAYFLVKGLGGTSSAQLSQIRSVTAQSGSSGGGAAVDEFDMLAQSRKVSASADTPTKSTPNNGKKSEVVSMTVSLGFPHSIFPFVDGFHSKLCVCVLCVVGSCIQSYPIGYWVQLVIYEIYMVHVW